MWVENLNTKDLFIFLDWLIDENHIKNSCEICHFIQDKNDFIDIINMFYKYNIYENTDLKDYVIEIFLKLKEEYERK